MKKQMMIMQQKLAETEKNSESLNDTKAATKENISVQFMLLNKT